MKTLSNCDKNPEDIQKNLGRIYNVQTKNMCTAINALIKIEKKKHYKLEKYLNIWGRQRISFPHIRAESNQLYEEKMIQKQGE